MILFRCFAACTALALSSYAASPDPVAALQQSFAQPPADARPMMRWWWFGPAVTKPEIERELRAMKQGGIGGVEIQPVYPLALDDASAGIRNLPYLSDEFIEALRFANQKARELGLRVDITLGSGWPYGGPHISASQSPGRLRVDKARAQGKRIPLPPLGAGEKIISAFLIAAPDRYREIPIGKDGIDAPASGEIWYFIAGRTGQQVKRPAVGADGFVLDHMDRNALATHLKIAADRLMQAFNANPPYAIFCDSLEVYGGDWTPALLPEFQKRRGYDLRPLLPSLFAESGPDTAGLRHDWGRTLTELTEENLYRPLLDWAKRHHTLFRIQGYGLPPAAISSYALSDLPEGEGHHWKILRASRWAASASHLLGRPITSSETWTWLHSPSFRATPLDLKAEVDLHFLQGINQLIGHGWPYTPPGVEYPGWRLYAAAVFDDSNPWYHAMPEISAYLQRVSWLLRQGRPANDIGVYLSNSDGWAHLAPGRVNLMETQRDLIGGVVGTIIEAGYNLDFFDDGLLDRALKSYRVIVMPGVETMSPAVMRKFEEFVRGGGTIVPTRRLPDAAPGYRATDAEHAAVRDGARSFAANLVKDESGLAAKLHSVLAPGVAVSSGSADFGFIRRSLGGVEIYFLANTGNRPLQAEATFRIAGLEPQWWDPMTGRATPAPVLRRTAASVTLALDLAPYASSVVVFTRRSLAPAQQRAAAQTLDISSGWTVTAGTDRKPAEWASLHSWSDEPDLRYYSGLVTYEKIVTIPAAFPRNAVRLDFGAGKPLDAPPPRNGYMAMLNAPVREAAVVYVNGKRAGAAWCAPYVVDITAALVPGENRIRIVAGNTAMNYMAGHRLPDYRLLNLRYGVRFEPQDMDKIEVLPSGLLGPIHLVGE